MRYVVYLCLLGIIFTTRINGQVTSDIDSAYLVHLNQKIDLLVVDKNVAALDTLYSFDFVFSHGSGKVEGKKGWLGTVGRADYTLRQHDSVQVELHDHIAVVKGKMSIRKVNKDKTDSYHLKYIRVYVSRKKGSWQLISHNTTHERHD